MANRVKRTLRRRLIRSYATSTVSISLVLALIGASAVLALNASNVAKYFKENMIVSVILRQNVDEKDAQAFAKSLQERDYVRTATCISREQGAEELKALLGEDFLNVFETTPVPVSIDLNLVGDVVTGDSLNVIKASLASDARVEEVSYQESLVEALNENLNRIVLVVSVIVLVLLVISVTLISNTVRLNVHSRRFTIHTMQLVGARRRFIRKPFVRQALVQGIVAGLLASALLAAALWFVKKRSPLLFSLFDNNVPLVVMCSLVVLGALICALSSVSVVNRLAYASKDELYY